MPGHWLLARLGERVLRPGGLEPTAWMLGWMLGPLGVGPEDDVVELAPGLGVTARRTLAHGPASDAEVERDEGWAGAARLAWNPARDPVARRRVLDVRRGLRRHGEQLCAIAMIARKPGGEERP